MKMQISIDISNYINEQEADYQIYSVMKREFGKRLKEKYKNTNDGDVLIKINELIRANALKIIKDLKHLGHKCEGCECNSGAMRIHKLKEGVNNHVN